MAASYIAVQGTRIAAQLALLTLCTIITRSDAMSDIEFAVPSIQLDVLLSGTVSATRSRPAVALDMTS